MAVRGLAHRVPDRQLLDELDLRVEPGGSVAVLGPSGSGKTTLLHRIAGIVAAQRGHVEVAGVGAANAALMVLTAPTASLPLDVLLVVFAICVVVGGLCGPATASACRPSRRV